MDTLDTSNEHPSPQPMTNTILKYGSYLALSTILVFLAFYLGNISMVSITGGFGLMILMIGISIMCVIMAVRHQRDTLEGGFLSFGRAFAIVAGVIMLSTLISSVFNYVFYNFIDTEYISNLISDFTETWGSSMPEDSLEEATREFENMGTAGGILKSALKNGATFALIIGLITAAIMKKEPGK